MTFPPWHLLVASAAALAVACAASAFLPPADLWIYGNPAVTVDEPVVIPRPAAGDEITIVLGGDFAPADAAMPFLEQRGYRYPYLDTRELLAGADIAFANLEAPVTDSDARHPHRRPYYYKVAPEATAAWQWLGLDVVSLANNHIHDYRARGIADTLRHLDAAGIATVGAGLDEGAARRAVIFDVGGTRVGFIAYLEHKQRYNRRHHFYAIGDHAGAAQLNRDDAAADVRRLRAEADLVIASVHWGENYADVTEVQEDFAAHLAALGVDVIVGHHSHDLQPVERLGDTLVFYSLGNYAFGTPGDEALRVGALARLRVTPRRGDRPAAVRDVELIPLAVQNRIVAFQPRPLVSRERAWLKPWIRATAERGVELVVDGELVTVTSARGSEGSSRTRLRSRRRSAGR